MSHAQLRVAPVGIFLIATAAVLVLAPVHAAGAQAGSEPVPTIHFHAGSPELLSIAYPGYSADPEAARDDIEWTRENSEELIDWWDRQGALYLQRAADLSGFAWPYRDIEVFLVRRWPTVSIEYPLVLALDEVQSGGRAAAVPEDADVRILLLAHQLAHYLLDPPAFLDESRSHPAREHPFLAPGNFDVEAMVNWVLYAAFRDLWGAERLEAATEDELWRAYNPNHDYVVHELMERHRLSRTAPLVDWLADHPRGSEIFGVRDTYASRAGEAAGGGEPVERERTTGTDYGLDLGATYGGDVFVAYVDEASPAARAGVLQGDILRTIEARSVADVGEARQRMDAAWEEKREINLSVLRDGREVYLSIEP